MSKFNNRIVFTGGVADLLKFLELEKKGQNLNFSFKKNRARYLKLSFNFEIFKK